MPVMNGLEATLKIRELEKSGELPRRTRIVGLTGNAQEDQVKETIQVRPLSLENILPYCLRPLTRFTFLQSTSGWNGCESASLRQLYALETHH